MTDRFFKRLIPDSGIRLKLQQRGNPILKGLADCLLLGGRLEQVRQQGLERAHVEVVECAIVVDVAARLIVGQVRIRG